MKKQDFRAVGIIVLGYLFLEFLGVTCPIKHLTGISCAGCGMSRAWLALVRGDAASAFSFHPLLLLPIPAALLLMFWKKLSGKLRSVALGVVVGAFLVVYILRMLDPEDAIVVFQPRDGLIWRTVEFVYSLF